MRLILSSLLTFTLLTYSAVAQKNPKTELLLDKVANVYGNYEGFEGTFTMKIENEEADISEIQQGKYWVSGNMYRLETDMLDRICNGKTIWTVFKDDEEVQISNFSADEETFTPTSIFTLYKKGFNYPSHKDTVVAGQTMTVVDLYPTNDDESFSKIALLIKKTSHVHSAICYSNNGSIITYNLGPVNAFKKQTDTSMFKFNPNDYEGLDLDEVDLR